MSEILVKSETNELRPATNDELFTELLKRMKATVNSNVYFVDRSTLGRTWSIYGIDNYGEYVFCAKEIKQK